MTPDADVVAAAERNLRLNTGIVWDCHPGATNARNPQGIPEMPAAAKREQGSLPPRHPAVSCAPAHPTRGAAYAHDGTLEGVFTAMQRAMSAGDRDAELPAQDSLQPRLGQEVVPVATDMHAALQVRRLVERTLGTRTFHAMRTACASDDPRKGTAVYRFLRHALDDAGDCPCTRCPGKRTCVKACEAPLGGRALDDIAHPDVFALMQVYRSVMNERHLMEQFVRFEHREGDVWFARCNPKASVVPLLMDWFVPRFNDQRFIIYDENHALSGVYDGARWYLVKGDAVTPPPPSAEETGMREAWRRFYRSVSVDARYHPELRRNFMPMRLWHNLTEMQPA